MTTPTAAAIDECVASGWDADDIAEEFGITVSRAQRLMERRSAHDTTELTPTTILTGLTKHRTLTAWSRAQGQHKPVSLLRIAIWRDAQGEEVRDALRIALRRESISESTIRAVCGADPELDEEAARRPKKHPWTGAPEVSSAEAVEDARRIARWGHV